MKNLFVKLRSRGVALKTAVLAVAVLSASQANAALPAWATSIMTGVTDNVTDVLTAVGPIFGLVVGGFFVFKIIKRGISSL